MSPLDSNARLPNLETLEDRIVPAVNFAGLLGANLSIFYSIDGTGNNLTNTTWGSTNTAQLRIGPASYGDGSSTLAGADRPSARVISNALVDQEGEDLPNERMLSAMIYVWGQFIDHDMDLTPTGGTEALTIAVPAGDPFFDPQGTGTKTINTTRSTFTTVDGIRQQLNKITSFMDGSMVYGSDATTAASLRTFAGGLMKTSEGDLLPLASATSRNFVAGDIRVNENIELTAMQTLFVREHNYWAGKIAAGNPKLTDEQIYQRARTMVVAEIQSITYNQWLPAVLGEGAIKQYRGYDPTVNPSIANEFSTAGFRFGHSLLGDDVEFLDNSGKPITDEISLSEAFFNPEPVHEFGIDPLLKYLASDPAQELDTKLVGSVRNFLFGQPGSGGFDLASLNIARGRDHGLADYNTTRAAYGLPRVTSFAQITDDPEVQAKLQATYGNVDKIDLWVGALSEKHVRGASVGALTKAILVDQFTRLRDGDRFWYQNILKGDLLRQVNRTTLSDIIERNTDLTGLQRNSFYFKAGIAGVVFNDANVNGRQDRNERPVSGQTVQLVAMEDGSVIATAKTNTRGEYTFDVVAGLRTGDYQVRLVTGTNQSTTTVVKTISITSGDQFVNGNNIGVRQTGPQRAATAAALATTAPTAANSDLFAMDIVQALSPLHKR